MGAQARLCLVHLVGMPRGSGPDVRADLRLPEGAETDVLAAEGSSVTSQRKTSGGWLMTKALIALL